jgi:tRNA (guanine26-N2/guanine27-N2)-dimethyltransferase
MMPLLLKEMTALAAYKEGKADLFVPPESLETQPPPTYPIFFNPRGKVSRDFSVICYGGFAKATSRPITFCDLLSGMGARAVRVGVEVEGVERISCNDWNEDSISLAQKNIVANHLEDKAEVSCSEASSFAWKRRSERGERFSVVDVDPFGSPSTFLDSSLRLCELGGMLSAGATDSAVLNGVYPSVCFRRYKGYSIRCDFSKEVAVRLLLGGTMFAAIREDLAILPLFCHVDEQYTRAYCRVFKVKDLDDLILQKLGFILYCDACGFRDTAALVSTRPRDCPHCRGKLKTAGPLWIDKILDRDFIAEMLKGQFSADLAIYKTRIDIALRESSLPPCYYSIPKLSDRENVPTPSPEKVVSALVALGYRASRSSFSNVAVRTDAPIKEVRSIVKQSAGKTTG